MRSPCWHEEIETYVIDMLETSWLPFCFNPYRLWSAVSHAALRSNTMEREQSIIWCHLASHPKEAQLQHHVVLVSRPLEPNKDCFQSKLSAALWSSCSVSDTALVSVLVVATHSWAQSHWLTDSVTTHSLTHSHLLTDTQTLSVTVTHSQWHSLSLTDRHLLTQSHTRSLTDWHSLSLTQSLSLSYSLTDTDMWVLFTLTDTWVSVSDSLRVSTLT